MIDPKELRIGNYVEFTPAPDPEIIIQETYKDIGTLKSKEFNTYMKRILKRDNTIHVYYAQINELNDFRIKVKRKGVVYNTDISCISPISITEELILKFGFSQDNNTYSYGDIELSIGCNDDSLYLTFNWNEYQISSTPILYLHQLQNIYFDLTGKELMVNL